MDTLRGFVQHYLYQLLEAGKKRIFLAKEKAALELL